MAKYSLKFLMDCAEVSAITLQDDLTEEQEGALYANVKEGLRREGIQELRDRKDNTLLVVNMAKVQSYIIIKE